MMMMILMFESNFKFIIVIHIAEKKACVASRVGYKRSLQKSRQPLNHITWQTILSHLGYRSTLGKMHLDHFEIFGILGIFLHRNASASAASSAGHWLGADFVADLRYSKRRRRRRKSRISMVQRSILEWAELPCATISVNVSLQYLIKSSRFLHFSWIVNVYARSFSHLIAWAFHATRPTSSLTFCTCVRVCVRTCHMCYCIFEWKWSEFTTSNTTCNQTYSFLPSKLLYIASAKSTNLHDFSDSLR